MDVVAIALIGLSFAVFYATVQFCDRVVNEQGGQKK